jgi:hypothetical protein
MAGAPVIRRPKSDGRCFHCREILVEPTKDHVFPSSWYPDSTPENVQRWTVPSCGRCNGEYGDIEKELFVYFALCLDPQKAEASGLAKRALRSFGVDVSGISEEERLHRQALRDRILKEMKPYTPDIDPHVIPGLEFRPELRTEGQKQVGIPADKLHKVLRKIVRGSEYWLAQGRIIDPTWEITVHLMRPADVPEDVRKLFSLLGTVYLGPGLAIRRAVASDGSNAAIYRMIVWGSVTYYSAILPPE